MTKEQLMEAFKGVMEGKFGLHLFLMGDFFDPPKIGYVFSYFEEFVVVHHVPVKVTWTPRWAGGPFGMYCFAAKPEDCPMTWESGTPTLCLENTMKQNHPG